MPGARGLSMSAPSADRMRAGGENGLNQGLQQAWRWYGPSDPVNLADVRQAGAEAIVTALHETYDGRPWSSDAIAARKHLIEEAGLTWSVVESIPIHPSIKLGTDEAATYIEHFATTTERLAEQGIFTVCYNFMPVVDWTRTDLRYPMRNGGLTLRFDAVDFAAYDLCILGRKGADIGYDNAMVKLAKARAETLSPDAIKTLETTIIAGLPGSELSHSRESIRQKITEFSDIDDAAMFANLAAFLKVVVPRAEACGARLCIHPDDPPFPLFGLPRVVSTASDYQSLMDVAPSPANGITLCSGSLGSRPDNDLPAMVKQFGDRIHFVHLRNVTREPDGSFVESDHLGGDVDMVAVLDGLLAEQNRRRDDGRADWQIPIRPDHGPLLLDDQTKTTNPGYSAIGRLKGLAELRGIMAALTHPKLGQHYA
jgi:mannonate dehydratase